MRDRFPAVAVVAAFLSFLLLASVPAQAATPQSGTITKTKRSVHWSGGPFTLSDPFPDPTGFNIIAPSCHTDTMCDHFALKVTLGDKATFLVKIRTPNPNPSSGLAQPVTGDDYDLYVYDPDGNLVSGDQGNTPAGNEKATIVYRKKFKGRPYDIAVRPYAVMPGSSYTGTVTVLTNGT
jgi:hypothetical protein